MALRNGDLFSSEKLAIVISYHSNISCIRALVEEYSDEVLNNNVMKENKKGKPCSLYYVHIIYFHDF